MTAPLLVRASVEAFLDEHGLGSEPAPGAGSVIAKQERTSPAASGAR